MGTPSDTESCCTECAKGVQCQFSLADCTDHPSGGAIVAPVRPVCVRSVGCRLLTTEKERGAGQSLSTRRSAVRTSASDNCDIDACSSLDPYYVYPRTLTYEHTNLPCILTYTHTNLPRILTYKHTNLRRIQSHCPQGRPSRQTCHAFLRTNMQICKIFDPIARKVLHPVLSSILSLFNLHSI